MQKKDYLTVPQFREWLKPFIPALRVKHVYDWCDNGRLRCETLRLKNDRGWKRIPIATECLRFLNEELDFTTEERREAITALRKLASAPVREGKLRRA